MLARKKHLPCAGHLSERLITCITGGPLKAGTRPHLHTHDAQGHAQAVADRSAMNRPAVSGSLQAMMDMDSTEGRQGFGFCQAGQEVQQDGRVKSAERDVPGRGIAPGGQGLQELGG